MQTEVQRIPGPARTVGALLIVALWVAAIILASDGFIPAMRRVLVSERWIDFQAYYLSASLLNRSEPVYSPVARRALGDELDLNAQTYNSPPFFSVLMRPLTLVPYRTAGLAFFGLGVAALGIVLALLWRPLALDVPKLALLSLLGIFMPATIATLASGQLSLVLTLLFALAFVLLLRGEKSTLGLVAGVCIGLAAGIKVYPILLAVPFLLYRRWKTLAVIAATFAATLVIGIFAGGGITETWIYWTQILPAASELNLYPPNQSARAAIARLFEVYPMTTTVQRQAVVIPLIPLLDAPVIGRVLGWVVVVAILAVTLYVMRRRARTGQGTFAFDFALMIPTMLMVIPLSWDHYETHLLLPIAVAGLSLFAKPLPRGLAAVGVLLLVLHRYWNVILFQTPYAAAMCFGFLGAFCLWLALLWNPLPRDATHQPLDP